MGMYQLDELLFLEALVLILHMNLYLQEKDLLEIDPLFQNQFCEQNMEKQERVVYLLEKCMHLVKLLLL